MNDDVVLEGGCLCGNIRYRCTKSPVFVSHCHCERCRRHSGALFATDVGLPVDGFTWLHEKPTYWRSSKALERGFCSNCGSTISHALGKIVLLVAQHEEGIPFNLKHRQHTIYDGDTYKLKHELVPKLAEAIRRSTLGYLYSHLDPDHEIAVNAWFHGKGGRPRTAPPNGVTRCRRVEPTMALI